MQATETTPGLVLASSSSARQSLLSRLGIDFEQASPDVDESLGQGESPEEYVCRLSASKARALASRFPSHLIIGSDQACVRDGEILGKPGNAERACAQLRAASGKRLRFVTGLTVLDTRHQRHETVCEHFIVDFRVLCEEEIATYVEREQPFNCAGSFKAEGLGIALFSGMQGEDITSLVGLPLLRLCSLLRQYGLNPLGRPDGKHAESR